MKHDKPIRKTILSIGFFILVLMQTHAQGVGVKGKVMDDQGIPVIGANIIIKGSTTGVVTDINGDFTITVASAKDHLLISFIGLETKEITVGNQTLINVTLTSNTTALSEIVVMGYSEKKKSEITSAVSVVSADQMKDVVASDMTTMLQGKVAGVQIASTSGQPGQPAEIRIRGTSSFTGRCIHQSRWIL